MNEVIMRNGDGENDFVCFCPSKDLRASICRLVMPYLSSEQIKEHMGDFLSMGLTADSMSEILWSWQIKNNLPELLASGIKARDIVDKINHDQEQLEKYFDLLLEYGADINDLLNGIGRDPQWYRTINLDDLLEKGAKPDIVARGMLSDQYVDNGLVLRTLLEHGADLNLLVSVILENDWDHFLIDHYATLNEYGKLDLEALIYDGFVNYRDVLTNIEELEAIDIRINPKRFAKMVAKHEKCSYRTILRDCGIE